MYAEILHGLCRVHPAGGLCRRALSNAALSSVCSFQGMCACKILQGSHSETGNKLQILTPHCHGTEADAHDNGMQAGLVHFTRSASGRLAKAGINLYCLCPQFVDTPLVANVKSLGQSMPEMGSQLLTPQRVHLISC